MADTEAMKQAIVQAALKAAKAMVLTVNRDSRRQAMAAGHQNVAGILRP